MVFATARMEGQGLQQDAEGGWGEAVAREEIGISYFGR